MGMPQMIEKFTKDQNIRPHLSGIYPMDNIEDARFAVNFFITIGLGAITEELREFLKTAPAKQQEQKY